MRLLIGLLFTFVFAAATGLGATWLVAGGHGPRWGGVTVGAWTAWPRNGTPDIDPLARAAIARSGELPLGSGDGLLFLADRDDTGRPLDGRCDVTISGMTPPARFWTLTVHDPNGGVVANALGRHGFTSQEVLRRRDGSFAIVAAPYARPGNWLPTGGVQRYRLGLRLYDTAVGVTTRAGRETRMPSVAIGACP